MPSPNFSTTGGGILLGFTSEKTTSATRNIFQIIDLYLIHNKARNGVGGGLCLLYIHSPYSGYSGDEIHMKNTYFIDNQADYGHAFVVQSSPRYRKALLRGITATEIVCAYTNATNVSDYDVLSTLFSKLLVTDHYNASIDINFPNEFRRRTKHSMNKTVSVLSSHVNPVFQIRTNTSMIFLISAQIKLQGNFFCGAASQGILAVDSEILLLQDSVTTFEHCVAMYGGAIAWFGESYIRHEGQSAYISEVEGCSFFGNGFELFVPPSENSFGTIYMLQLNQPSTKLQTDQKCLVDDITHPFCNSTDNLSSDALPQIVSHPDHMDGAPIDLDNPMTIKFIPGKQKQLPHKHAYDKLGNAINTVFTVQIFTQDPSTDVQLNPFSKYTADFTVILHGIPLKHGMANSLSTMNESNKTGNATPQLVLQSVDNNLLLLIVNIEIQCCPPGYIYRIGSGDKGTCHCGMATMQGIAECNETDSNNIGAVLQRDYWARYLQFNDQHSCDGQKLFTAPCPPGYCQT